jgi:DNA-directed RNA polymerase sigma subunit (sigma70/sigma32)
MVGFRDLVGDCRYLSADEERAAFAAWRAGDRAAGELIFRSLFRFMLKMTAEYVRRHHVHCREDAEGWATDGLLHAMRKWDPDRGVRFILYARRWILVYLMRGQLQDRIIHIPVGVLQRSRQATAEQIRAAELVKVVNPLGSGESVGRESVVDEVIFREAIARHRAA